MGAGIPQIITETKASGAQVIDGSLKFNKESEDRLTRIMSAGNQTKFTLSCWLKPTDQADYLYLMGVSSECSVYITNTRKLHADFYSPDGSTWAVLSDTQAIFRDPSAWYHVVATLDSSAGTTNADRYKIYVNGVQQTIVFATYGTGTITGNVKHVNENGQTFQINSRPGQSYYNSFYLSQYNYIDGQALDASYFGYTDPLTNTWRPKKYEGTFTQTSFNNGTTWSSSLTSNGTLQNAGNAFDGDLSSRAQTQSPAADKTLTFAPPAINFTQKLEVYCDQGSAVPTATWDGNTVNPGGGAWVTVYTGSGTLSSTYPLVIDTETASQYATLKGVRIDGEVLIDGLNGGGVNSFYLPMDGNSPIGDDKSGIVTLNDGRTWSNSLTSSSGFRSSEPKQNAFDGDTSSICSAVDNGTITFTSPVTFASNSTIQVIVHGGDHTVTVNGGANQTISAGSLQSVTYSNSGNATFIMTFQRATVADTGVRAIEINGVILTDGLKGNSWTPVNFGGSVALPKATGARPILNTDGGGNVARPGVFGSEVGAYYDVTVSNPGSGNKYYFDTVLTPTPTFYRGSTYTFDYTAATSHPLYLSALSDGKHNSKAYSVQFDGTGDYLTLAQSNDFDLTGDYTYEAFIYYTDTTNNPTIFDFSAAASNYEGRLQIQAGTLYLYNSGWVSKGAISANTWHHIAVTQDFIFVDGINIGSGTGAISGSNYKVVTIGARTNDGGSSYGDYFTGYISNVRIVNGTALYTENFTVPTTTLTNVTNTKLLCCQDNNATTAVVAPGDITAVGNAAASNTYNPFVYNIDNYFGVDTSTSNVTKQVIPHSAVDTLYYFCNIHSGMGGSANIVTDETKADPYAWKNVLALPLVGSDDDVSNSVNSGSTTKVTASTNAVASSAASNFYGESWIFDGSGDYIAVTDNADLAFGTGDLTVELWVYPNTLVSNDCLYDGRQSTGSATTGFSIVVNSSGQVQTYTAGGYRCSSTAQLKVGKWSHIAVVRSSGTDTLFMDGIAQADTDTTNGNYTDQKCRIGSDVNGDESWGGHISDFRLYKGVAKYTSNFIPASTNPDILPETPSGVSGGSKLAKVTDGAVSFDGTGDYLNMAWSSDFTFGTDDFTIEMFVNWRGDTSTSTVLAWGEDIDNRFDIGCQTANQIRVFARTGGSTFVNMDVANGISINKWIHLALVRNSSAQTMKLYIDGVEKASTSSVTASMPTNTSNGIDIGRRRYAASTSDDYQGFISNIRFLKGTALYTSNFTPPTRELTNITNTKLLCCQSNTSATAAAVEPSVTGYTGTGAITLSSASLDAGAVANIVDGKNGTSADIRGAGSFVQMVFPQQQNGTLQVDVANGNDISDDNIRVFIDGVEGTSFDVSSQTWHTIHTGDFTTVKLEHQGSTTGYIYGFRIGTGGDTIINGGIVANGDAAATNFNPFITDINAVRGQETGYNILNPLAKASITLSNGNLDLTHSGSTGYWQLVLSTIGMSSGKFYCEFLCQDADSVIGIAKGNHVIADDKYVGQDPGGYSYNGQNGQKINNSSGSSYGSSYTAGDVIGIAFDGDNGTLRFYKNNIDQGQAFSGLTDEYFFAFSIRDTGHTHSVNFGQKPFKFPPPEGFQPLNGANVKPETVIVRPDQYVGVTTYTSNNNTLSVSDYQFQPDLLIFKNRDTANHWGWFDSVREANKQLSSNRTNAEITTSGDGYGTGTMNSFDRNGFTLGNDVGSNVTNYPSGDGHVVYGFNAGGNKNTFNIDDVGYANASDINMSVGSLNSSTYNTSAIWSSMMSGPSNSGVYTNMFNGTLTGYEMPTSDNTLTFTPSGGITANTSIRILLDQSSGTYASAADITVNGASIKSSIINPTIGSGTAIAAWIDIGTTSLTTLTWSNPSGSNNDYRLYGIEVDGKKLVDSNQTPPNVPSLVPTGASVNTKSKFGIYTWNGHGSTNETLSHGLGAQPDFMICKKKSTGGNNWVIWHKSLTSVEYLMFTPVDANDDATLFNSHVFDSNNLWTLGTNNSISDTGESAVAYLWCDVPGLQKFGSYTGDASGNPFIELGFRPKLLWIKNTSSGSTDWIVIDSQRQAFNSGTMTKLYINSNSSESTIGVDVQNNLDLLSNGFKLRDSNNRVNASNDVYIYCAWAEAPTFNLYGGQSNAR